MPRIAPQPTALAEWYALVGDAQVKAYHTLNEALESYLVFILMRFIARPESLGRVMAVDYLRAMLDSGERQLEKLRSVGDICLLHAGLFPNRAQRRRVSDHYYAELGRSAYGQLAQNRWDPRADLFRQIADAFSELTHVLAAIRNMRDGAAAPEFAESLALAFTQPAH
jgi:hypothetical protein